MWLLTIHLLQILNSTLRTMMELVIKIIVDHHHSIDLATAKQFCF